MSKLRDVDKKLIDYCNQDKYPLYKLAPVLNVAPSTIYNYNRKNKQELIMGIEFRPVKGLEF